MESLLESMEGDGKDGKGKGKGKDPKADAKGKGGRGVLLDTGACNRGGRAQGCS